MTGTWLFLRARSIPLVAVVTLCVVVGFSFSADLQLRWGQPPLKVAVPFSSLEPVVLSLLFFLTRFSPASGLDALGGRRTARRLTVLHATTLVGTSVLILGVGVGTSAQSPLVMVRTYGVYVATATAAGTVMREPGFALVLVLWVFSSLFGVLPGGRVQWWALPYRDGALSAWFTSLAWVVGLLVVSWWVGRGRDTSP